MKKLFLYSMLALVSLTAQAQLFTTVNKTTIMTHSGDTVYNANSKHVDIQSDRWFKSISFQAVVTKIAGTVAGSGKLYGSNDGTNYFLMTASTDTLVLANATTSTKMWVVDGSPYKYYRIVFTGIGSGDSCRVAGYVLPSQIGGLTNNVSNMLSAYAKISDTITNGATNSITIKATQWFQSISIQAIVTKISGTVAGTVTLQGSNNGLNYVTVATPYLTNVLGMAPYSTTGATATLTALDQAVTTKIFTVTGSPYQYYKLSYTGTGTMVATLKGYILPCK